jgi:COMPASS component SWD3
MQYLQEEGYTTSSLTLQDETNVKLAEQQTQRTLFKRMRKAILDGDWVEVDKLCSKTTFQQQKSFQYAAYREQFIELIEAQEYQKAFTHLTKRLKPLESSAASLSDFKDLCYLLTCRSVHEVLPNWQGAAAAREALLTHFATMLELEERRQETVDGTSLPAHRLVTLLEQAAAYQVGASAGSSSGGSSGGSSSSGGGLGGGGSGGMANGAGGAGGAAGGDARHGAEGGGGHRATTATNGATPLGGGVVSSLLRDYSSPCVPNTAHRVFRGHGDGVKSVAWLGESDWLLSGGNDQILRVWSVSGGTCVTTLRGHTARIWQLAVSRATRLIASAAADGTVRLWRLGAGLSGGLAAHGADGDGDGDDSGGGGGGRGRRPPSDPPSSSSEANVGTLRVHDGDVYSVHFHPTAEQIVTSGYDKSVRLLDAAVGVEQRQLVGHELPAREAVFNATGNLVVSGGKDATIRFWDVRSALCVRKLAHSLGEVTSVRLSDCGTQLLTSSKDNSVRLWDVRAARPLRAFKGHQNTAKNFVRARFGPTRDLVLSGSEDGSVCLWSLSSGKMAHRLCGHTAVSYDAAWCGSEALLASCSHDGTVRTWQHDPDLPLSPDGQIGLW